MLAGIWKQTYGAARYNLYSLTSELIICTEIHLFPEMFRLLHSFILT
jgi:hypothetical protein